MIVFCASLPDPGQGCAAPSPVHCAEQTSVMKSYARISSVAMKGGAAVGVLVCVGSGEAVGVLVGPATTFTCTQISPVEFTPSPKRLPVESSNDQMPLYRPGASGAFRAMEMSTVSPGVTIFGRAIASAAPMRSPPMKTNL